MKEFALMASCFITGILTGIFIMLFIIKISDESVDKPKNKVK